MFNFIVIVIQFSLTRVQVQCISPTNDMVKLRCGVLTVIHFNCAFCTDVNFNKNKLRHNILKAYNYPITKWKKLMENE